MIMQAKSPLVVVVVIIVVAVVVVTTVKQVHFSFSCVCFRRLVLLLIMNFVIALSK